MERPLDRPKVLIVDDVLENLEVLTLILEADGIEVLAAPSGEVALRVAGQIELDLVLLDVLMPGLDGLSVCKQLRATERCASPVIFISAKEDTATLVEAFAAGGVDYITKPIQRDEVRARVGKHLELARLSRTLERQNRELTEMNRRLGEQIERRREAEAELQTAGEKLSLISDQEARRWGLPVQAGFVGNSSVIQSLSADIRRLHAFANTNVLITGESGSGKELVARAIHYGGLRRRSTFLPVNCSAIPGEIAESLFFGHVRGAFSGATQDRKGYFELADKGPVFLDEIADLPAPLQAKLLRALEDGSFLPVGSNHERRVDVRVIAATNADLEARAVSGSFRQDLYFRLAQYAVHVPPLRDRPEDIPLLAAHFFALFAKETRIPLPNVRTDAMEALMRYDFPGNVRELKNVTERALIASGGSEIGREQIEACLPQRPANARKEAPASLNLNAVKEQLIAQALSQTHGNVTAAAQLLGVHRSWFYRRKAL
ncbi:MAG TPA: sigma-54 dependent transcriptional regulator [Polyangiales bacterium]|nr:sigma-54 dependent transcriptional regulator [Polyangiales bacterium]